MDDLSKLVREALDRERVEVQGCFMHNAAAVELLKYWAAAIPAIEAGVVEARNRGRI